MAMNSAVLLAEENRQLHIENQRQKKKRAERRSYIATGGVLTFRKGWIYRKLQMRVYKVG